MQAKYFALWITVLAPTYASAFTSTPDIALLEFLGTVDSDSREWTRYLIATDPNKAVTPPAQSVPVTPATSAKPTAPVPPAKAPVNTPSTAAPPTGNPAQSTPPAVQPTANK